MNKNVTRYRCVNFSRDRECTLLIREKAKCSECNFYVSRRDYIKTNGLDPFRDLMTMATK